MQNIKSGIKNQNHPGHGYSRRDLLRMGALGAAGAGLSMVTPMTRPAIASAAARSGSNKLLFIVNMHGGCDGLNTLVPMQLGSYFARRPGIALEEGETLSMNSGPFATTEYRLHPSLNHLAEFWSAGDLAAIQAVGYPNPNESHFESESIWSRSMRDTSALTGPHAAGWVARFADRLAPTPTGAIAIGAGNPEEFKGGETGRLTLGYNLSDFKFEIDGRYASTNDPYRKDIVRQILERYDTEGVPAKIKTAMQQGYELEGAIQEADENYTSSVTYPSNSFGVYCRNAAKLIQSGFDTRIFYMARGGYDTHGNQAAVMNGLHNDLDDALGALALDLKDMGLWHRSVIMLVSEFGRRIAENGSAGTDHGAGNCMLLLGGGVHGGLYGPTLTDADLQGSSLAYQVDFRSIYREVLGNHMGANPAALSAIIPEEDVPTTTLGIV